MDCLFISDSKWWTRVSSALTIRDRKVFPSASKRANSEEIDLHDYDAPRNTSRTHRWTSKTQNDVPNTSFADWKTERHLSSCDASILTNDGTITLQYFRTNSCDTTAWARQTMALCFQQPPLFSPGDQPCFSRPQHFINVAKILLNVSHWFFLGSKLFCHRILFVPHIMADSILRPSCSGAICQKSLQIRP